MLGTVFQANIPLSNCKNNLNMIYSILVKIRKYSLSYGVKGLAEPLTRLLNIYWLRTYTILEHTTRSYSNGRMLEFTFDLTKLGDCTPQILGFIWYTIIIDPKVAGSKGNKIILLYPEYINDEYRSTGHYVITSASTPEDFTKHFLHLTSKGDYNDFFMISLTVQVII